MSQLDTKEKEQQSGKNEIEDLNNDIVSATSNQHQIIGIRYEDKFKNRSLMVTLRNVNEKERINSNLYKLKKFGNRGISFIEDLTITKRKKIKDMC